MSEMRRALFGYFLGCFGEMGGEWICLGVVDLLGIISFFLLSLVVRKLVVGYLKDTNAGECPSAFGFYEH